MEPTVITHYISDEQWATGYFELLDTTVYGNPPFNWPLPKGRVFTVLQVGHRWHIMRLASDCKVDPKFETIPEKPFNHLSGRREGEGGVCEKCGGAYTTAKCPACMGFGGES